MKVVRASDVERSEPPNVKTVQQLRPVPLTQSPPQSYSNDVMNVSDDEFERRYQKRLDRILRAKELELIGITPQPKKSSSSTSSSSSIVDRKTELVKVAQQLKEEYQALNDAASILREFSKPNPVEVCIEKIFDSGLVKDIGIVLGQIMLRKMETHMAEKQMGMYQNRSQCSQIPQEYYPRVPVEQIPNNQGSDTIYQQPSPLSNPTPTSPQPTVPQNVNLRLDENDKKLMEQQQELNVKIVQSLAEVAQRIEKLNERMNLIEKSTNEEKIEPKPAVEEKSISNDKVELMSNDKVDIEQKLETEVFGSEIKKEESVKNE